MFVHYLAHERSHDGTCECDTIEKLYYLAGLRPCVYCGMDKSFTSSILSVKGVRIKLYTTCKSKTVANCVLVGLAFMIVTQLCDLCHEIPLFDRALVENHLTVSSMYH